MTVKRVFGLSGNVMLIFSGIVAVAFVVVFFLENMYSIAQFIVDYGFQLAICGTLVALLLDWVRRQIPDVLKPNHHGAIVFFTFGLLFLMGCGFTLVFYQTWSGAFPFLWIPGFLLGLYCLWAGHSVCKFADLISQRPNSLGSEAKK